MKLFFIDFSEPILPQLYALAGPVATPLVSAITIGHHMYNQFGDPHWLAIIVGVGAFLGFEACGGACVASAIKLHRRANHNIDFWICLAGISAYMVAPSLIIKFGYGPLVFSILAAFAVFAGNTFFTIEREDQQATQQKTLDIQQTKTETNKINAETRRLKAEQIVRSPEQPPNISEQSSVRARIYQLLETDPEIGPREMSRTVKCSVSTASKWINQWKEDHA